MIAFYIALGIFVFSLIVVIVVLSVKIYERSSGKLLFSRRVFEKSDDVLVHFFKRVDKKIKHLAIMSHRRKLFKVFRLGKAKHVVNRAKKAVRKLKK
jgi:hypothetical protein